MVWDMAEILGNKKRSWLAKGLAEGKPLRKLSACPLPFTKKMAHYFINAPFTNTFDEAVWYALTSGNTGLQNVFSPHFRSWKLDPAFLLPIIRFFEGPGAEADPEEMPDLLGYMQHRWDEDGTLSTKGWTLASLRRRVQEWYLEIAQQRSSFYVADTQWAASGYQPYEAHSESNTYRIVELTRAGELIEEGMRMQHCVGSYTHRCVNQGISIWSLRIYQAAHCRSLVTIEVDKQGRIVQARGKRNAAPQTVHVQLIRQWAQREGLKYHTR